MPTTVGLFGNMLSVPFHSQYGDEVPHDWQAHACSIVNLVMVLEFLTKHTFLIAELIREGESIGGFGPRGWTHDAIVLLAHNHGVQAYRQEFRSCEDAVAEKLAHDGFHKIEKTVREGTPVIVSVQKENGSYHTVTVIHTDENAVIFHDPEAGENQELSRDEFLKKWRRLAIFFG